LEELAELKRLLMDARPADWGSLPDIPLYMDQVVGYLSRQTAAFGEGDGLTPAMINNYIKDGLVERTLDRSALYAVQTPQVFDASLIRAALQKALDDGAAVTDDCAAVERLGKQGYLTRGSYENIKITTPEDLILAEAILQRREGAL